MNILKTYSRQTLDEADEWYFRYHDDPRPKFEEFMEVAENIFQFFNRSYRDSKTLKLPKPVVEYIWCYDNTYIRKYPVDDEGFCTIEFIEV